MPLTTQFNALSYIQVIAQLIETSSKVDDIPKDSCWKCSSDHQNIVFCPVSPQTIQSKHTFDLCMDPISSPSQAISKTNLSSLFHKAFEGHHIGILSLGIGSKTDNWRHQWMMNLLSNLKEVWISCSEDRKIEFSFCLLGLKGNDILDYSTLEVLSLNVLLEHNLTIEDLLIRGETNDSSIDSLQDLLTLLQRPFFVCTLLIVYYYVEFNDHSGQGYNGSIRLCDLGHFGQDHLQSGLDAMKDIALLLQQPYLSTDLPYDKHVLTWLLSDCIGGNSQCCLTVHIDDHHSDEYCIQAARFCELIRTIKTHPSIDIEQSIDSRNHYETINNMIVDILNSCKTFKDLCEEQSLLLKSEEIEKIIHDISLRKSRRELEYSLYDQCKDTIAIIEHDIDCLHQQISSIRDIQYDGLIDPKLLFRLETRINQLDSQYIQKQSTIENLEEELKRLQSQNHKLESEISILSKVKEEISSQLKQVTQDSSSQTLELIKRLESEMQKERALHLEELKSSRNDASQLLKQRDDLFEELNIIKQQINENPAQDESSIKVQRKKISRKKKDQDISENESDTPKKTILAASSFVPTATPKPIYADVSDENTSFLTNLSFQSNKEQNTNTLRQFTRTKSTTVNSFSQDKSSALSNIMAGFHVKSIK